MRRSLPKALVVALAAALILTGCTGGTQETDTGRGSAISAERCAQNEAAGEITYLTGYQYQSSASILEVISAEALGYYDALCLDVTIEPGNGDTGTNAQVLAANTVQFSAVSQQDLLLFHDNGVQIRGISSYSDAGLEILMTMPQITELPQLDGTTLGHKGSMPTTVLAMLDSAGVDVDSLTQVTVGFDPSVLPRGQVQSLTGFLSNEPNQLAAAGTPPTVWRPYDYGVPSSLGALAVNPAFADANPSATEDFLRATFRAFDHCAVNAEECVGYAADVAEAGYDTEHNLSVWQSEVEVIRETAEGPLGEIDPSNIAAINQMLIDYGLVNTPLSDAEAEQLFDPSVVPTLYDDSGALIWPAP